MAVPKSTQTRHVWQCASKGEHRTITQVTPSLHLFSFELLNAVLSKHIAELKRMSRLKKHDVGIGVLVLSFYALFCWHTAIHTCKQV